MPSKKRKATRHKKPPQHLQTPPTNSSQASRGDGKDSDSSSSSSSSSDKDTEKTVTETEEFVNEVKDVREGGDVIVEVVKDEMVESGEGEVEWDVKEIGVEEIVEAVGETVVSVETNKEEELVSVVEEALITEEVNGGGGEAVAESVVPASGGEGVGEKTDRNAVEDAAVARLEHGAKWWNCCGLFEVFLGSRDNAR